MDAFAARRTTRNIAQTPLPPQALSDLLWAAWGVNRASGPFNGPGRTAASASGSQEIDLFVAMADGVYFYNPHEHRLDGVSREDVRPHALVSAQYGTGAYAPLHLILVADVRKLTHTKGLYEPGLEDLEVQKSYYYIDAGLIAGNIYLFAAANGLGAWFHNCNRVALAQDLNLREEQKALFALSVGYPSGS